MSWWHRLWHRGRLEAELEKELRFHLDQHVADLVGEGHSPSEARRLARLALGGVEQAKEECRDARGTRWVEDLWQDCRYAVRTLRHNPGFAVPTLATLALGIGATTVMFTVVASVLLKPLPFPEPDRLVTVTGHRDVSRYGFEYLAYPDFLDCRGASRSLDLAGWVYNSATLSAPGEAEYEQQVEMSDNLFSVLGVRPFRGRAFLPEEDKPGGRPVAILGYSLWQRHFGGAPDVVGSTLVLDGNRYTIVGIAPPAFELDGEGDIYTPLGQDPAKYLRGRAAHPVRGLARLRPGATMSQAVQEFATIGRGLAERYPDTNKGRTFRVQALGPDVADVRSTLWLLLGAVVLVLLIACSNVASLTLARGVSRERQLAMRLALGAGRFRLVRQSLTESMVLGLGGGVIGLGLAALGIGPFLTYWPGALPRASEVQLDWRVAAFAVAVSLASGILFGIAPALRVPKRAFDVALRTGARTATGSSRRLHTLFVVAQMAIAVVLLVSAGTLGRALLRLSAVDPGVKVQHVLVSRMALSPAVLSDPARIRTSWADVLERASRVPGVEAVSLVDTVPLREGNNQNGYWTTAAVPPENRQPVALSTCVTRDYLAVMGIPLRGGRFFSDDDRLDTQRVIVVDDVLARNAFGRLDVVGRHLWIPDMGPGPLEIVGVVGHVRYWGLAGDDRSSVRAQFYYPFAQVPDGWLRRWSQLMSITVRTSVPPLTVVQPLRHELRGAANDQVLYEVRTLEQLASASLARQRFLLLLFGIFAVLSLLLACIGIYGVLAYFTNLRVPEFGVRVALGATTSDVLRLVFGESLAMIGVGAAAGTSGALVAARVLDRLVEGIGGTQPATFGLMTVVLVGAALVATYIPARRASRVDAMTALRQE